MLLEIAEFKILNR